MARLHKVPTNLAGQCEPLEKRTWRRKQYYEVRSISIQQLGWTQTDGCISTKKPQNPEKLSFLSFFVLVLRESFKRNIHFTLLFLSRCSLLGTPLAHLLRFYFSFNLRRLWSIILASRMFLYKEFHLFLLISEVWIKLNTVFLLRLYRWIIGRHSVLKFKPFTGLVTFLFFFLVIPDEHCAWDF